RLDPEETILLQAHTTLAAEALSRMAERYPASAAFFRMAHDIARHHHERYDGRGYPDGLAGEQIPLAARIVAIADTYDRYRTHRPGKPALSHMTAIQLIVGSEGQFDPRLSLVLQRCAATFER